MSTKQPQKGIHDLCKRLRLGEAFVKSASQAKGNEREFLIELLESEVSRRDAVAIERNIRLANFPPLSASYGFDFKDVRTPTSVAKEYFTGGRFIIDKANLFLFGRAGTGKTSLAVEFGLEATKNMHKVAFFTLPGLVGKLRMMRESNDKKFHKRISKLDLIIIDEFGYPPLETDTAGLLFEFVSRYCYEKTSVIMTSNRTFNEIMDDFKSSRDEKMVGATIDRLVQDCFLFDFQRTSFRASKSKMT